MSTRNEGSADLGGNVSTGTYSQSYAGPVTLSGADRVLTASLVNFQNTVVGGGNSLNVAGPATFGATVSGLDDLSVSGNASVAANVTGTGSQTFTGRVNLTGDATFTGTSGSFSGGLGLLVYGLIAGGAKVPEALEIGRQLRARLPGRG